MPEVENRKSQKALRDQRPFLGLRSFEEKNKSQFGGRDKEIKELFGLDENSVLTVIFGKSGIGKTSLIKAGLIPELQQNFYFPIYVRIDYSSSRTPLEQVKKVVYDKMKERDPGVSEIGDATLWEYFHNVNLLDDLFTPVLILDQFEEIFTLGEGKTNVRELLIQLADLAENRIPLKVQAEYQKLNRTVPTHYAELPYRVVLSLREDYLARLEELKKYMPSIMNSRFRVVQMTVLKAMDAAIKPGKGLIDEKVAKEIIKKMPGVVKSDFDVSAKMEPGRSKLKVEPFLLSLICDRINEKRIEKKLKKITLNLVSDFNVTDVIYSFYNETITPYGENVERAIENCLLTEGGFRKLQAMEEFQLQYEISDEVVDQLVDARILRKETRDGVEYLELIHDVLAPIIKGKRSKRARIAREKEKDAIIENARLQRARLIKTMAVIAVAVVTVLVTISWLAYDNDRQRSSIADQKFDIEQRKLNQERRNKKMVLASNLLFTAERTSTVERNTEKGALIARLAYLLYKKNKNLDGSEDMYQTNFYNAMYLALKNNGHLFFENQFDTVIKPVFRVGNMETDYKLDVNGMLYIESLRSNPNANSILVKSEFEGDISMDLYQGPNKNLLVISGVYDSIFIRDIDTDEIIKKIVLLDVGQDSKAVSFTEDGGLIMLQKSGMFQWDNTYEDPTKFNFSGTDTINAIKYNPIKDSLIVGTNMGEVFTVSVNGEINKSSKHIAHTSGINDIAVSPDGKWLATVGQDNVIVIWNSQNWNALPIKANAVLSLEIDFPHSVSFTPDSDYVLVCYQSGTILKWPVSLDVLAQLICKDVAMDLTKEELEAYLVNTHVDKEDFDCK